MAESKRVVYAALAGNVGVAIAKFAAATASGSGAMLTEAIHSTADAFNQLLLLVGNHRSESPADREHPFGYGLEIYFWTFVVAVMVLLAGGVASLYEGFQHLRDPEPITSPAISLGVLALAAIFEGFSLTVGYREFRRLVRGRRVAGRRIGLWRFIVLSKDPNLYESLLEDLAALIGIFIAALGISASVWLDLLWADGAASIAIGVLLVADSWVIAMATKSLIAGEAASPILGEQIDRVVRVDHEAVPVTDIATLQLGPQIVLVALTIDAVDDAATSRDALDRLTLALKRLDGRIQHVLFRYATTGGVAAGEPLVV